MKKDEERFLFGKNWLTFLKHINKDRILEAEFSLKNMLGVKSLEGKTFLDVGCGSGLFSLAAHRLGAKVYSFDYDKDSVMATKFLKDKFYSSSSEWKIEEGSVLDKNFLKKLDKFDFVYSWGVLHHTRDMYTAMNNISITLKRESYLYIAIYNKQPVFSNFWSAIKKNYNKSPQFLKKIFGFIFYIYFFVGLLSFDLLRLRDPFIRHKGKGRRGMNFYTDVIDWIGGWPFEVAMPEEILDFYFKRGLILEKMKTCGGKMGCNEFLFRKNN